MADNIEIEIIYSNLSKERVALEKIDQLLKDNVLIVAVLAPDPEKEGKTKKIIVKHSFDHYALCLRAWDSAEWIMLYGWNDGDVVWTNTSSPFQSTNSRREEAPPFGCFHVVFNGIQVSTEKWKRAKEILNQ